MSPVTSPLPSTLPVQPPRLRIAHWTKALAVLLVLWKSVQLPRLRELMGSYWEDQGYNWFGGS